MSEILILTLGSRGDVQPYVALGGELARRGHHVTLSTGQGFDALVDGHGHGLTAAPLSVDIRALAEKPDVRAALKSPKGLVKLFRSSGALMQRVLDEMWAVACQAAPDIILYHPKAFLAPYFARALGCIAVPGFLQPAFTPTGAFANPLLPLPPLGAAGNRLSDYAMLALMRLGYGTLLRKWLPRHDSVPGRPRLDVLGGYHPAGRPVPRLYGHSRHMVPKPADWGPVDHVTGYWFLGGASAWEPPAGLAAFIASGPPPVYLGFGSMPAVDDGRAIAAVLAALRRTDTRAVLARGWGVLATAETTDTVHVIDSVPHDWLFPRCSAVVHHGGAGSTHEGLRWGRPTLVCPVFADQPFWGRTVSGLGAGPAPVPLKKLGEDALAGALAALRSDRIRAAADRLGARIRSEDGTTAAADLIDAIPPAA